MKQLIRQRTFETNSSTTHSLVIIPEEHLEDWENSKLFYMRDDWGTDSKALKEKNNGSDLFTLDFLKENIEDLPKELSFEDKECADYLSYEEGISSQEKLNDYSEEEKQEILERYIVWILRDEYELVCTDNWYPDLEEDSHKYTDSNGKTVYILCKFGYDG